MRVWFVELGEPLPIQTGQRLLRYGELTRVVARRGHQVVWWACNFSHQTLDFVGVPNTRVNCDGVEIVLVGGTGYRKNVSLARLRHVSEHARNLAKQIGAEPLPDVIVTAIPTIEACEVISAFASARRIPVVIDVRDEWPEDYIRWLPRALRPLGRLALAGKFAALQKVCKTATAMTAVTERQLAYGLEHAGRPRRVTDAVFHTGARSTRPDGGAVAARVAVLRSQGLSDSDFICVFTGTLSPSRPLEATIAAVKNLSGRLPVKLVIAGKGDLEQRYRKQAAACPDIVFVGWVDAVGMGALNEIADVLVAPYSAEYGFSLPTKIFDYMAAGRPLLSSCPGEAEELIRRERIGVQIRAEDAAGIEAALQALHDDPEARRAMGRRARELFEREFAIEAILERYADYIERIAVTEKGRAA
ncbi:MAG: glycosyltransferase family 4 protein [Gammaproteobacteria bacterium]